MLLGFLCFQAAVVYSLSLVEPVLKTYWNDQSPGTLAPQAHLTYPVSPATTTKAPRSL